MNRIPNVEAGFPLAARACFRFFRFCWRSLLSVAENTKVCICSSVMPALVSSSPSEAFVVSPASGSGSISSFLECMSMIDHSKSRRYILVGTQSETQDILELSKMTSFNHAVCFIKNEKA